MADVSREWLHIWTCTWSDISYT